MWLTICQEIPIQCQFVHQANMNVLKRLLESWNKLHLTSQVESGLELFTAVRGRRNSEPMGQWAPGDCSILTGLVKSLLY